jgi:hypothetical protein
MTVKLPGCEETQSSGRLASGRIEGLAVRGLQPWRRHLWVGGSQEPWGLRTGGSFLAPAKGGGGRLAKPRNRRSRGRHVSGVGGSREQWLSPDWGQLPCFGEGRRRAPGQAEESAIKGVARLWGRRQPRTMFGCIPLACRGGWRAGRRLHAFWSVWSASLYAREKLAVFPGARVYEPSLAGSLFAIWWITHLVTSRRARETSWLPVAPTGRFSLSTLFLRSPVRNGVLW